MPFFWTVQYGKSLRYVGFGHHFDNVIVEGTPEEDGKFVAFYTYESNVIAVATLNRDPVAAVAAHLFKDQKMPSRDEIETEECIDLLATYQNLNK